MNKFKSALIKTGKFLRKNVYYVVIVVAVAAICAIVGVTVSKTKQAKNSTPVVNDTNIESPQDKPADKPNPVDKPDPVKPDPVVFIVPVKDSAVGASFSETELVFSKTLEQWSTHRAIDFMAEEGASVFAVWDGTVSEIVNDPLYGYCVSISHGDGLVTKYCGLSDKVNVSVSQTVKKGAKIGEIGNNMIVESADGTHLHFETYKDGKLINPEDYFVQSEK